MSGNVPSRGLLKVMYTAVTAKEIGLEFSNFWSKMWLRDTRGEQFSNATWTEFDAVLDEINFPDIPQISYSWHDMQLWMHLIKSLPSAKAVGPCGWSNDELKKLHS